MPTPVRSEALNKTLWKCRSGHHHSSKQIAESCDSKLARSGERSELAARLKRERPHA